MRWIIGLLFLWCSIAYAGDVVIVGGSGGAPTDADYLVGTANGTLSAEIAVGTTPGGELGGTWASPTLDDSVTVTGWVLGASTATTPAANDNDTSLATTAWCETTQAYYNSGDAMTGTLTGDVTGNVSGSSGSCTGNSATATLASTLTITDNENTAENNAVIFTSGGDLDGGNLGLESDGDFYYTPSTGILTATGFAGALTGNVTGNASGSSGSCTGNAATATTASAGDSATAFFSAGTIEHEYGGLEADVSAYNGFVYITGGTTSAKTPNAGTDITADLEEEVTEGSLADSTVVSADIKNGTIAGEDLAANIAITSTGVQDYGGAASVEIPNGAGGTTVDAAGEVCVDTTSKTLNIYDGAAETVLNPIQSKSVTIEDPTGSEDISLFYTDDAITITKMVFVITGSTSATTTIRHGTDRSAAGAEVVTGGTVANSTSTGNVVTAFNDATVVADSFIWLETTALADTPDSLAVTIFFKQDP